MLAMHGCARGRDGQSNKRRGSAERRPLLRPSGRLWMLLLLVLLLWLSAGWSSSSPSLRPSPRDEASSRSGGSSSISLSLLVHLVTSLYASSGLFAGAMLGPLRVDAEPTVEGDGTEPQLFPPVLFLSSGATGPQAITVRIQTNFSVQVQVTFRMEGDIALQGTVSPTLLLVQPNSVPWTREIFYTPPASTVDLRAAFIIVECDLPALPPKRYPINFIALDSQAHISGAYFGGGGMSTLPGYRNGPMRQALFNHPGRGVLDPSGDRLYIPDAANHVIRMWRQRDDVVSTLWGPPPEAVPPGQTVRPFPIATEGETLPALNIPSGASLDRSFNTPTALALHSDAKRLFISDTFNNRVLCLRMGEEGDVNDLTQLSGGSEHGDGPTGGKEGPRNDNYLPRPGSLAVDAARNRLYVVFNAISGFILMSERTPALAEIDLSNDDYVVRFLTQSFDPDWLLSPDGMPDWFYWQAPYHFDTFEPVGGGPQDLGHLGAVAFIELSADANSLYVLSAAMAPVDAPPEHPVPSVLRVLHLDRTPETLSTVLSYFYSPKEPLLGVVEDGLPLPGLEHTKGLMGSPTSLALHPDGELLYFIDSGLNSYATYMPTDSIIPESRAAPVYCNAIGHDGVDCDASIRSLNLRTGEVHTLAGGRATSSDGVGADAGLWSGHNARQFNLANVEIATTNTLLMHPSGEFMYVFEGTENSRIRRFTFASNELRTIGGGGGTPADDGVSRVFGAREGVGKDALFASPYQLAFDDMGRYLYVSDAWSISQIDMFTASSVKLQMLSAAQARNHTLVIPFMYPQLSFHAFHPLIVSPYDQFLYAFQLQKQSTVQFATQYSPLEPVALLRIDTEAPGAPPVRVSHVAGSHGATVWDQAINTMYPLAMAWDSSPPGFGAIYVSETGEHTRAASIVKVTLQQATLANSIKWLDGPANGFGAITGMVVISDWLYCLDVTKRLIFKIDLTASTPIPEPVAGGGDPDRQMIDGTGAAAAFSFVYHGGFNIEQRPRRFRHEDFQIRSFYQSEPYSMVSQLTNSTGGLLGGYFQLAKSENGQYLYCTDVGMSGQAVLRRITADTGEVRTLAGHVPNAITEQSPWRTRRENALFNVAMPSQSGWGDKAGMTAPRALAFRPGYNQLLMGDYFHHHIRVATLNNLTPHLTSLEPTMGLLQSGSSVFVQLDGVNLDSVNQVKVVHSGTNSELLTIAYFTFRNATRLVFRFPGSSSNVEAGVKYLFRANRPPGAISIASSQRIMMVNETTPSLLPQLHRVSPTYGIAPGSRSATITIHGANFGTQANDIKVSFYYPSNPSTLIPVASTRWEDPTRIVVSLVGLQANSRILFHVSLVGAITPATALAATNPSASYQTDAPSPLILDVSPGAAYVALGSPCRLTIDGVNFGNHPEDVRVVLLPLIEDEQRELMFACHNVQHLAHPLFNRTMLTCVLPSLLPPALPGHPDWEYDRYQVAVYAHGSGSPAGLWSPFQVYPRDSLPPNRFYSQVANSAAMVMQMGARLSRADLLLAISTVAHPFASLNGWTQSLQLGSRADNLPYGGFGTPAPNSTWSALLDPVMPSRWGGPSFGFSIAFHYAIPRFTGATAAVHLWSCRSDASGPTAVDELAILLKLSCQSGACFLLRTSVLDGATTLTWESHSPDLATVSGSVLLVVAPTGHVRWTMDGVTTDGGRLGETSTSLFGSDHPARTTVLALTNRTCFAGVDGQPANHPYFVGGLAQLRFWTRALSNAEVFSYSTPPAVSLRTNLGGCADATEGAAASSSLAYDTGRTSLYLHVDPSFASVYSPLDTQSLSLYPNKRWTSQPCSNLTFLSTTCLVCEIDTRDYPTHTPLHWMLRTAGTLRTTVDAERTELTRGATPASLVASEATTIWNFSHTAPGDLVTTNKPAWSAGGVLTFTSSEDQALDLRAPEHNPDWSHGQQAVLPAVLYDPGVNDGFSWLFWVQLLSAAPNQLLLEVLDVVVDGPTPLLHGFVVRTVSSPDQLAWGLPHDNKLDGFTPNTNRYQNRNQRVALRLEAWTSNVMSCSVHTRNLNLGQWISVAYSYSFGGRISLRLNGADTVISNFAGTPTNPTLCDNLPVIRATSARFGSTDSSINTGLIAGATPFVPFHGRMSFLAFFDRALEHERLQLSLRTHFELFYVAMYVPAAFTSLQPGTPSTRPIVTGMPLVFPHTERSQTVHNMDLAIYPPQASRLRALQLATPPFTRTWLLDLAGSLDWPKVDNGQPNTQALSGQLPSRSLYSFNPRLTLPAFAHDQAPHNTALRYSPLFASMRLFFVTPADEPSMPTVQTALLPYELVMGTRSVSSIFTYTQDIGGHGLTRRPQCHTDFPWTAGGPSQIVDGSGTLQLVGRDGLSDATVHVSGPLLRFPAGAALMDVLPQVQESYVDLVQHNGPETGSPLGNSSSFNFDLTSPAFSFSLWLLSSNLTTGALSNGTWDQLAYPACIFDLGSGDGMSDVVLGYSSHADDANNVANLHLHVYDNQRLVCSVDARGVLRANTWHSVTVSASMATGCNLYADGQLVGSDPLLRFDLTQSRSNPRFGNCQTNFMGGTGVTHIAWSFAGDLASFAWWPNHALNAHDALLLFYAPPSSVPLAAGTGVVDPLTLLHHTATTFYPLTTPTAHMLFDSGAMCLLHGPCAHFPGRGPTRIPLYGGAEPKDTFIDGQSLYPFVQWEKATGGGSANQNKMPTNFGPDFTISLYFRLAGTTQKPVGGIQTLWDCQTYSGVTASLLYNGTNTTENAPSGVLVFSLSTGCSAITSTSLASILADRWYAVVARIDQGVAEIFVDGVLATPAPDAPCSSSSMASLTSNLGSSSTLNDYNFMGHMSHFAWFKRVLTLAEISIHAQPVVQGSRIDMVSPAGGVFGQATNVTLGSSTGVHLWPNAAAIESVSYAPSSTTDGVSLCTRIVFLNSSTIQCEVGPDVDWKRPTYFTIRLRTHLKSAQAAKDNLANALGGAPAGAGLGSTDSTLTVQLNTYPFGFSTVRAPPVVSSIEFGSFDEATGALVPLSSLWKSGVHSTPHGYTPALDHDAFHFYEYIVPYVVSLLAIRVNFTAGPVTLRSDGQLQDPPFVSGVVRAFALKTPTESSATGYTLTIMATDGSFVFHVFRAPQDASSFAFHFSPDSAITVALVKRAPSTFKRSVMQYNVSMPRAIQTFSVGIGYAGADSLTSALLLNGSSLNVLSTLSFAGGQPVPPPSSPWDLCAPLLLSGNGLALHPLLVRFSSLFDGDYTIRLEWQARDFKLVEWQAMANASLLAPGTPGLYRGPVFLPLPLSFSGTDSTFSAPFYCNTLFVGGQFTVVDTVLCHPNGTNDALVSARPSTVPLAVGGNQFSIVSAADGTLATPVMRLLNELMESTLVIQPTTPTQWSHADAFISAASSRMSITTLVPILASIFRPDSGTRIPFTPGVYAVNLSSGELALPYAYNSINVSVQVRSVTDPSAPSYTTTIDLDGLHSRTWTKHMEALPFPLRQLDPANPPHGSALLSTLHIDNSNDGFYAYTLARALPEVRNITWHIGGDGGATGGVLGPANSRADAGEGGWFTFGRTLLPHTIRVPYSVRSVSLRVLLAPGLDTNSTVLLCVGVQRCDFGAPTAIHAAFHTGRVLGNVVGAGRSAPLPLLLSASSASGLSAVSGDVHNYMSVFAQRDGFYDFDLIRAGADVRNVSLQLRQADGSVVVASATRGMLRPLPFHPSNDLLEYSVGHWPDAPLPSTAVAVRFSVHYDSPGSDVRATLPDSALGSGGGPFALPSNGGDTESEAAYSPWFPLASLTRVRIMSDLDGAYTFSLNRTEPEPLAPAYFNVSHHVSSIYTGEISSPFTVTASRLPRNVAGITLLVNSSRGESIFSTSVLRFGPHSQTNASRNATFTIRGPPVLASQLLSVSFRLLLPNMSDPASTSAGDLDLLAFALPAPFTVQLLPYPGGHFGLAPPRPCTCNSNPLAARCDEGPYATGNCTCLAGFTGATCNQCLPNRAGPSCLPCPTCSNGGVCTPGIDSSPVCVCPGGLAGPMCERCASANTWGPTCSNACPACAVGSGTCDAGITGTGQCICAAGWGGPLCQFPRSGVLVGISGAWYGMDGGVIPTPVQLNASASPFTARVLSLPILGRLFQTIDGRTLGTPITSTPVVVTNPDRVLLYLPPSQSYNASRLSDRSAAFAFFTFDVSAPAYNEASVPARVDLFLLRTNTPPVLLLRSWPSGALLDPILQQPPALSLPQKGRLTFRAADATPLVSRLTLQGADAEADVPGQMLLRLQVARGTLSFDRALLTGVSPAAALAVDSILSNTSIVPPLSAPAPSFSVRAPLSLLNSLLSILVYTPLSSFYGPDELQLVLNDEGQWSVRREGLYRDASAAGQDARFIPLLVEQVNQPIRIVNATARFRLEDDVSGNVTVLADSIPPFLIQGVPTVLASIQLEDPDAYSGAVSVRLVVSSPGASLRLGALPAAGPTSLAYQQLFVQFQRGSGYAGVRLPGSATPRPAEPVLEFSAPLTSLNRMLSSVIYSPSPSASGVESLAIWVSDNGNTCGAVSPTNPCTVSTDSRTLDFTIPRREYPPRLTVDTEHDVMEGAARSVLALAAEDPNAGGTSPANVSLRFFVTDLTLQRLGSATSQPVQLNWGALGRLFQFVDGGASPSNFGPQLFPAASIGAPFPRVAVSDPQARLLLKLSPYFFGPSLLSFNFTAVKRVEYDGVVSFLPASRNATARIRIAHVNHAPFVSNGAVSTLSASDAAVVFERDFFPSSECVLELVGDDMDQADVAHLRFWIADIPPPHLGNLYQLNDTAYEAMLSGGAAASAALIASNSSAPRLRGARIGSAGAAVSSRYRRVVYMSPADDPGILAIQLEASRTPEAFTGLVFPTYTHFAYRVVDPAGLQSGGEPARVQLHLSLPVIPILPQWLNVTGSQESDVLLIFQPVYSQRFSVNFSAVIVHSLPSSGELWTRDPVASLNEPFGHARGERITRAPYRLVAHNQAEGDEFIMLLWTPPDGLWGTDVAELTYAVESSRGVASLTGADGEADAKVSISLLRINHAPQATPGTFLGLGHGSAVPGDPDPNLLPLHGTDSDDDALTAIVRSLPRWGWLEQVDPATGAGTGVAISTVPTEVSDPMMRLRYHASDTNSTAPFFDSFAFAVRDGQVSSGIVSASLLVHATMLAPQALAQTVPVAEVDARGTVITLEGLDSKAPGIPALSFIVTRLPVRGTLRQLSGEPVLPGLNIQARAPSGGGRQVRFVPPATRGYGPNFDSFDFAVRDLQGLQSEVDATVTIDVVHSYEAASVWEEGLQDLRSRHAVPQDSAANPLRLNVAQADAATLGAVVLSLPARGGRLFACDAGAPDGVGQEIIASMLPFIAPSCASTPAPPAGSQFGTVELFYTPAPRVYSDALVAEGVFESFAWAAYDPTTLASLYLPPQGVLTAEEALKVEALVTASPPVALVQLVVTLVNDPPESYGSDSSAPLNAPQIVQCRGAELRNNRPVRAFIHTLPRFGLLYQVDDARPAAQGTRIHAPGTGVTSASGRVRFEPEFAWSGNDTLTFFVITSLATTPGALDNGETDLAAGSSAFYSPLNPYTSPLATIHLSVEYAPLPVLVSSTPIEVELDQNERALLRMPSLQLDARAALPTMLLTAIPTLGDVFQVRDSPEFDYTAFVLRSSREYLEAAVAAAQASASALARRRRLFGTAGSSSALASGLATTTAADGSSIALSDLDLITFPSVSSWSFNASASILPPVAWVSAGDDAKQSGTTTSLQVPRASSPFPALTADRIRAEQLPLALSHPLSLLLYVPQVRQKGATDQIKFMLQPAAPASDAPSGELVRPVTPVVSTITVGVRERYLPPTALNFEERNILQNEPVLLVLQAANGNDATTDGINVLIDSVPAGRLCQLEPTGPSSPLTLATDRPCGAQYGEPMTRGSLVLDAALRLIYMPPLNLFGSQVDSFAYRVEDRDEETQRTYSAVATVTLSITHVNQRPMVTNTSVVLVTSEVHSLAQIFGGRGLTDPRPPGAPPSRSSPPSISLLQPDSHYTFPIDTSVSVPLLPTDPDPDDAPHTMRYFVSKLTGSKGRITYQRRDLDRRGAEFLSEAVLHDFSAAIPPPASNLAAFASQREVVFDPPVELGFLRGAGAPFVPPFLTFDPLNSGGALGSSLHEHAAAFLMVEWFATDATNLNSSRATISFRVDCGQERPGAPSAYAVAAATGLLGSNSTAVLPVASSVTRVANLWSNTGSMCASCPAGAYCSPEGVFHPISNDGYWRTDLFDMNGKAPHDSLVYLPCTPASACISSPFFVNSSNGGCAQGFASRLCAGCQDKFYFSDGQCRACNDTKTSLLALLIIGLPVLLGAVAFFILLAKLRLDFTWITVTIDTFQIIATLKHFALGWPVSTSSMLSGLGALLLNVDLLQLECSIPAVQYQQKWIIMMLIPIAVTIAAAVLCYLGAVLLTALGWREELAKRESNRRALLDLSSPHSHRSARSSMRLTATLLHTRTLGEVWWKKHRICHNFLLRVTIIMLKTLYLTISIKAQEPLKCTRLADGSLALDAQPSLSCDEAWYRNLRPFAMAATVIYAAGVPVLFAWILFVARPLDARTRIFMAIFRCPVRFRRVWQRESFRTQVVQKRRDACVAGQTDLDTWTGVKVWTVTFEGLTEDFNGESFYWQLVRCFRSLSISIVAIWMGNVPLYQATCALFVLWFAFVLHLSFLPYRPRSRVNTLESVGLASTIGILFVGLLLYSKEHAYTYSWTPDVLDVLIKLFTAAIGLAVLSLLDRHFERHGIWDTIRAKCGCRARELSKQTAAMEAMHAEAASEEARRDSLAKQDELEALSLLKHNDLSQATYSRWFAAPAPATRVERRRSIIGWIGQAVPGLKHIESHGTDAADHDVTEDELMPVASPTSIGLSVTVPADMRSFLDPNHEASDGQARSTGYNSSVEGSPTQLEMTTIAPRVGARRPLTPMQQQKEGILALLARQKARADPDLPFAGLFGETDAGEPSASTPAPVPAQPPVDPAVARAQALLRSASAASSPRVSSRLAGANSARRVPTRDSLEGEKTEPASAAAAAVLAQEQPGLALPPPRRRTQPLGALRLVSNRLRGEAGVAGGAGSARLDGSSSAGQVSASPVSRRPLAALVVPAVIESDSLLVPTGVSAAHFEPSSFGRGSATSSRGSINAPAIPGSQSGGESFAPPLALPQSILSLSPPPQLALNVQAGGCADGGGQNVFTFGDSDDEEGGGAHVSPSPPHSSGEMALMGSRPPSATLPPLQTHAQRAYPEPAPMLRVDSSSPQLASAQLVVTPSSSMTRRLLTREGDSSVGVSPHSTAAGRRLAPTATRMASLPASRLTSRLSSDGTAPVSLPLPASRRDTGPTPTASTFASAFGAPSGSAMLPTGVRGSPSPTPPAMTRAATTVPIGAAASTDVAAPPLPLDLHLPASAQMQPDECKMQ